MSAVRGALVVKFGGTSLGTPARIRRAARRVAALVSGGRRVVAVVSAMGHTTDHILETLGALETRRDQLTRMVSKGELQQRSQSNPEIEPTRTRLEALAMNLRVSEARRVSLQADIEADQRRVAELQNVYRDVRERKDKIVRLSTELAVAEAQYQAKSREVELMTRTST